MVLRANARRAVHNKAAGDIFQFLARHCPRTNGGHWLAILTKATQLAAALGTLCAARSQLDLHARDMIRDRLALRLVGGGILRQPQPGGQSGNGDLAHLQSQLQLLGCLGR